MDFTAEGSDFHRRALTYRLRGGRLEPQERAPLADPRLNRGWELTTARVVE